MPWKYVHYGGGSVYDRRPKDWKDYFMLKALTIAVAGVLTAAVIKQVMDSLNAAKAKVAVRRRFDSLAFTGGFFAGSGVLSSPTDSMARTMDAFAESSIFLTPSALAY